MRGRSKLPCNADDPTALKKGATCIYDELAPFFNGVTPKIVKECDCFVPGDNAKNYSYRKASIGSSKAAFTAGYKPENIATRKLVIKAAEMAPHGITKTKFMAVAIPKPINIPKIIPAKPPN